ncbi:MAG: 23S rRNA (uracil(1939)-C(5))-methyltransferase RlmD [Bacteroidota bacterium]|nr:23S rRNA (uracil(1939)-C(5))-methyltransferase RlmD [Bacteroidota bacterium]
MRHSVRGKNKTFQNVEILDTADEGLAIGRCEDGLIIQVKGAVPGDVVDAVAVEKRKGMYIASTESISVYSKDRTDPFCSHFGVCGGCKWQHMTYDAQIRFKEKKVHDAFRRIGELDTSLIEPIIGAPLQTYYRNKMEFTASDRRWLTHEEMQNLDAIPDKEGIGFHLSGAFDKVLDLQHCYLQGDPSNDIRQYIKAMCRDNGWSFFNLKHKTGFIRNVIVRITISGDVLIVLVAGEDDPEKIKMLVDGLHNTFPSIVSIYSCLNTKVNDSIHDLSCKPEFGEAGLLETLGTTRYHIGPKSFFQTNSLQAQTLYALTKQLAALTKEDTIYDLYCGVGSLGLFMADACKSVVGIEIIPEAIADAHLNARINQIENAQFVVGQVEMILDPNFIGRYGKPSVIITDPPRAGMHADVIKHMLLADPERIVYVSCNPATQARDLKLLSEKYTLQSAIPVDMFPHTHHIECIALLHRK